MSTPRRVFAFLAAVLVLLGAARGADAQTPPVTGVTIALNAAGVAPKPAHDGTLKNTIINYKDCAGGTLSFPLSLTGSFTGYTIEAWAGTNCTDVMARTVANETGCWKVYTSVPGGVQANAPVAEIPVRSIVAGYTSWFGISSNSTSGTGGDTSIAGTGGDTSIGGTGGDTSIAGTGGDTSIAGTGGDTSIAGTGGDTTGGTTSTGVITHGVGELVNVGLEACVQTPPVATGRSVTVFFMLVDPSTSAAAASAMPWTATFKLVGPPPPNMVSAGVGGNLLVVDFSYNPASVDTTIQSYNLYCDPPPGSASAVDAGLVTADAGAGVATDCGATSSQVLVAGTPGDQLAAYQCGSAAKTSQTGNATNLVNGVPYNVAVAAYDQFENTGPISVPTCQVPQAVTGFFKAYQTAGGKGGGGFCSFSTHREPLPLIALLGLASCLVLRRRRVT